MISKKELITRLCTVESNLEFIMEEMDKFEKKIKKLEPKKVKKVKDEAKK